GAEEPTVRTTLEGHTKRVVSAVFCLDGKKLVSRSVDGTTRLWDLATGKGATLGEKGWSSPTLTLSADGRMLIDSNTIRDVASGKSTTIKRRHFLTMAFSPDGKMEVEKDANGVLKLRELVTAFDVSAGKTTATLTGADGL